MTLIGLNYNLLRQYLQELLFPTSEFPQKRWTDQQFSFDLYISKQSTVLIGANQDPFPQPPRLSTHYYKSCRASAQKTYQSVIVIG